MDETRFRALFESTYPALARYARHRGLEQSDAEDLIATTFEVAWRRLETVPEGDDALLWLYTVAFNHLRNLRRRQLRDRSLTTRLPIPQVVAPPGEPGELSAESIRRALDLLSASDRELVVLVAAEGLSPVQAGAVLGCGAVVARTRLHRARKRLAALLEAEREVSRQSRSRHELHENDEPVEASK